MSRVSVLLPHMGVGLARVRSCAGEGSWVLVPSTAPAIAGTATAGGAGTVGISTTYARSATISAIISTASPHAAKGARAIRIRGPSFGGRCGTILTAGLTTVLSSVAPTIATATTPITPLIGRWRRPAPAAAGP